VPSTVAPVNENADLYPPGMAPPNLATPAPSATADRSPTHSATEARGAKTGRNTTVAGRPARDTDPMAPVSSPQSSRSQRHPDDSGKSARAGSNGSVPSGDQPGAAIADQQTAHQGTSSSRLLRETPSLVAELPESKPINAHVAPPREEERSVLPIVLGVAAALAVLMGAMLFMAMQRGRIDEPSLPPPATVERPQSVTPRGVQGPQTAPRANPADGRFTTPRVPGGSPPPISAPAVQTAPHEPVEDSQPELAPSPDQQVAEPAEPTTDADIAADDLPTEYIDDPFMDEPDDAADAPDQPPTGTTPPATAALLAELSETLLTAKNAAGEHEFGIARAQLGKAAALARSPEHQAVVTRLQRVVGLSEEFWTIVRQAMSELQGAEELPIGDSGLIVIVVEARPGTIVIRRSGRNESYPVADIPPGLAFAIADRKLDPRTAETALMKGACLAAMKNPKPIHVEEARRYWEMARSQGAEVDDLLATLTDSYAWK
jgi:hypothetical protein